MTHPTETDRELLELAARAVNGGAWHPLTHAPQHGKDWNPLTDDGDESRLEAELFLEVEWSISFVSVGRNINCNHEWFLAKELFDDHSGDRQAARRCAGVRAAAEIGRAMK